MSHLHLPPPILGCRIYIWVFRYLLRFPNFRPWGLGTCYSPVKIMVCRAAWVFYKSCYCCGNSTEPWDRQGSSISSSCPSSFGNSFMVLRMDKDRREKPTLSQHQWRKKSQKGRERMLEEDRALFICGKWFWLVLMSLVVYSFLQPTSPLPSRFHW